MKHYFLISCFLIASFTQVQAQKSKKELKQEKNEATFQDAKKLIESLNYEFVANQAHPQGGRSINLTTNANHLKIINDSVDSYLPFFGRSHTASFGSTDSGIKCNTKYTDYELVVNDKKQQQTIKFTAKGANDTYKYTLTVSRSGSASLYVISNNKSGINYSGSIQAIKSAKK